MLSPNPQRVGRPNEALHFITRAAISAPTIGARDGIHMKNTGKRIFFAVVAFLVVNAGVVVLAGALTSSR